MPQKNLASIVPWAEGHPRLDVRFKQCGVLNSKGRVESRDCSSIFPFVCETKTDSPPSPPKLSHSIISKNKRHGVLIKVLCTSFSLTDDAINFTVENDEHTTRIRNITPSDERFTFLNDDQYVSDGQYCGYLTKAELTIKASKDLDNGKIGCCRSSPPACQKSGKLKLKKYLTDPLCSKHDFESQFPCGQTRFKEYMHEGGTCIFVESQHLVSWDNARAVCRYSYGSEVRLDSGLLDLLISDNISVPAKGLHIGLHNRKTITNFRWLDDSKHTDWAHWGPGEPKVNTSPGQRERCVWSSPTNWIWRADGCDNLRGYICQRLSARNYGQPELMYEYPSAVKVFYTGKPLTARCQSYVQSENIMSFLISHKSTTTLLQEGDEGYSEEVSAFVQVDDRCLLRTKASVTFDVTGDMRQFACCRYQQDGSRRCTAWQELTIHYSPGVPKIIVSLVRDPVNGTSQFAVQCSAFVGTSGQLILTLSLFTGEYQWLITNRGMIYEAINGSRAVQKSDSESRISMLSNVIDHEYVGPQITAELKVPVDMYHSELDNVKCQAFCPDDAFLNTDDNIVTTRFKADKKTDKNIKDQSVNDLKLMSIFLAACMAFLGPLIVVFCSTEKKLMSRLYRRKKIQSN